MYEFSFEENIQWWELENGLRVVSIEMPSFYTISAGLFINVGSRYESTEEEGISHLIEHMLFKGSTRYSAYDISAKIEGTGGALNGYTGEENTCIYVKTFPHQFPQAMDVLLDMYAAPIFDQNELHKEQEVIIEEIRSYEDQPSVYIGDLFSKVIWGDHPLGNYVLGNEERVGTFTRHDLTSFFEKHYVASNTVLAVAGLITHDEVLAWAKQHQHRFRVGNVPHCLPYAHKQSAPRLKVLEWDTEQCQLQFGFPSCDRYSNEQWPLRVLSTILGENMSSRLFQEIREKRALAYHICSGFDLFEDVGCFYIQGAVEQAKLKDCLQASLDVLSNLRTAPISQDEIDQAKRFIVGQSLQDLESTMSCMLWAGEKMLGRDRHFTTRYFCDRIKQVTKDEVMQVAEQLFRTSLLNLAVIGPEGRHDDLENLLMIKGAS